MGPAESEHMPQLALLAGTVGRLYEGRQQGQVGVQSSLHLRGAVAGVRKELQQLVSSLPQLTGGDTQSVCQSVSYHISDNIEVVGTSLSHFGTVQSTDTIHKHTTINTKLQTFIQYLTSINSTTVAQYHRHQH